MIVILIVLFGLIFFMSITEGWKNALIIFVVFMSVIALLSLSGSSDYDSSLQPPMCGEYFCQ